MSETYKPNELQEALLATLASEGWRNVIHPQLAERLKLARYRLEDGAQMTLEQVRATQAEIRLLRGLVEKPEEAFET